MIFFPLFYSIKTRQPRDLNREKAARCYKFYFSSCSFMMRMNSAIPLWQQAEVGRILRVYPTARPCSDGFQIATYLKN